MTRVDAHLHVWQLARGDHAWITPGQPIHRDCVLDDVLPFMEDITAAVLVRSAATDTEMSYLLKVARASNGLVRGVVGWTDLAAPDAPARIAALAKDPLLKGLRPTLKEVKDSHWILRDEVKPALRAMADAGLCLDASIEQRHLPVIPMIRVFHPELKIVIDHAAPSPFAVKEFGAWADSLKRVADETDVCCRLSGLPLAPGEGWMMNDLRPWAEHILDSFTPARVMWGSDWPFLDLTSEYVRWYRIASRFLFRYDLPERDEVLGGTAMRFYGLA